MLLKRLLMVTLLVTGFGLIQASWMLVDCNDRIRPQRFRDLYENYEIDPARRFANLQIWVERHRQDIDKVDYYDGKTIGDRIAERLSTNEHRKEALVFAKIAQSARSNKHSVMVTLFKAYEKDSSVIADLKDWQDFVKADSSEIYYDSAKKITIAQRVEALNRDALTSIFKLSQAAPDAKAKLSGKSDDGKKAKWSMGKKVGVVTALAAGAGLLYYYMNNKDSKNKLSDQSQLPAVA